MKAAVLGKPISHSLSPVIHNAGYRFQSLSHTYEAIEIGEDQLGEFVEKCDSTWMGLSLTMPLKVAAFAVAGSVTPLARLSGSINTLVFAEEIAGYNTDIYGIVQAVNEATQSSIGKATIIGSGATARSALVACAELGANSVDVIARNADAILALAEIANELGITFTALNQGDAKWQESDLVINTTPAGVADELLTELDAVRGLLLDVVYHPWPTKIATKWLESGGEICPGYVMLLHQAVAQYELFTGQSAPVEPMRQALLSAIN